MIWVSNRYESLNPSWVVFCGSGGCWWCDSLWDVASLWLLSVRQTVEQLGMFLSFCSVASPILNNSSTQSAGWRVTSLISHHHKLLSWTCQLIALKWSPHSPNISVQSSNFQMWFHGRLVSWLATWPICTNEVMLSGQSTMWWGNSIWQIWRILKYFFRIIKKINVFLTFCTFLIWHKHWQFVQISPTVKTFIFIGVYLFFRQNIQHSQGLRKPFSSKRGAFICLIKCLGDTGDETIKQLWET